MAKSFLTETISIKKTSKFVGSFAWVDVQWNKSRLEKLKCRPVNEGVCSGRFMKKNCGRKGCTQEDNETVGNARLAGFANEHVQDGLLIRVTNGYVVEFPETKVFFPKREGPMTAFEPDWEAILSAGGSAVEVTEVQKLIRREGLNRVGIRRNSGRVWRLEVDAVVES